MTVLQQATSSFGKTSVGALLDRGMYANYKIVHSATLSVTGSVTRLNVYAIPGINASSPQALKAVIYADSGGSPGALLATGTEVTYQGSANGSGWFALPFGSSVALSPGTYWLGFITGTTTEGIGYAYDSVANSRAYNTNAYSAGPTNPFGSLTKDSRQASIYASYTPITSLPLNSVPPSISGTAQSGQTLSADPGIWSGAPTSYGYQWERCDTTGANCSPIAGATAQRYPLGASDAGFTMRVSVTAANAAGLSQPATSAQTAAVAVPQQIPANSSPPTITGTAQPGQPLSANPGTWTGSPTSYSHQWQRCDAAGTNCTAIASATNSSYTVVEADLNSTLRVAVVASNATGPSTPDP
jgi:hypothetical protein